MNSPVTLLETILHTLATQPGSVTVRVSTLRARAASELQARRPDLTLRKQLDHWAESQGVVVCWDVGQAMITFEQMKQP
jgi:hypothetical protein